MSFPLSISDLPGRHYLFAKSSSISEISLEFSKLEVSSSEEWFNSTSSEFVFEFVFRSDCNFEVECGLEVLMKWNNLE